MKKTLMIAVEQVEYDAATKWCQEGMGHASLEESLCYNIKLAALMQGVAENQDAKEIVAHLETMMDLGSGKKSIVKYLRERLAKDC